MSQDLTFPVFASAVPTIEQLEDALAASRKGLEAMSRRIEDLAARSTAARPMMRYAK